MPDWWRELVTIPNVDDPEMLACKIHASFQVLWVRCRALKDPGDYTALPTPKCIQRKIFLQVADYHLPFQDYQLKQLQRTLAYVQALQYWAEKANLPVLDEPCCLAMCVHELRWIMKPYMTFSGCNVFRGLTCKIPEAKVKGPCSLIPSSCHQQIAPLL